MNILSLHRTVIIALTTASTSEQISENITKVKTTEVKTAEIEAAGSTATALFKYRRKA